MKGIPPYRTISMFAAHNKTFCTPYQCSFLVIFRGTLSLSALFPPGMFHVEHSGGKKRRKRQCASKYNKKTALVRCAECFIMRCKHRNCPVGRDALHPAATLPCLCIINFVMCLTSICRDDEPLPIYFHRVIRSTAAGVRRVGLRVECIVNVDCPL